MKRRTLVVGAVIAVALAGLAVAARGVWSPGRAVAQAPAGPRLVQVEVVTAVRKPSPVIVEALGNVMPIESVAVRSRLDTEIVKVHFSDGAYVQKGDMLFTLDSRAIEAQIKQVEGNIARDKAQLEGAQRDVRRYTELVAKGATPVLNLDNAKTASDTFLASIRADEGALENLQVQRSYCEIRAAIAGRIGAANVKAGNFVRSVDPAPLAIIHQVAPIYVAFSVPQRVLPEVRRALEAGDARVEAGIPGDSNRAGGRLTMIDNSVDVTTGMVSMRATMDNKDQILWPGALVNTQLRLRTEDAVTVPPAAVQTGQSGNYVFVIRDDVASVRPVKVARASEAEAVIESGLEPGETVVVNGQLQLTNGVKVAPRPAKAGS